eukprot:4641305-Lingulodinium_polyedra.AAC.1
MKGSVPGHRQLPTKSVKCAGGINDSILVVFRSAGSLCPKDSAFESAFLKLSRPAPLKIGV